MGLLGPGGARPLLGLKFEMENYRLHSRSAGFYVVGLNFCCMCGWFTHICLVGHGMENQTYVKIIIYNRFIRKFYL